MPPVLDEPVPFIEVAVLEPDEAERFFAAGGLGRDRPASTSTARGRSTRAWRSGAHGLPLIGGGDWNDGMNRVGAGAAGESVWLGWFLIANLRRFATVRRRARRRRARRALARRTPTRCAAAAQDQAWDGDWYRRGWFDDGAPLGSAASEECRIDFDRPVVGGALRRRRPRRAPRAPWRRSTAS